MTTPQRRLTEAFINVAPVQLALIPQTKAPNGSGGFTLTAGEPREPQTVTLLAQTRYKGQGEPVKTEDGKVMKTDYIMVGAYDLVVEEMDYWIDGDSRYEVQYVMPDNGYERRAGVTRYGT